MASRATAHRDNATQVPHPAELVSQEPYFRGRHGAAYLGDSLTLLRSLPADRLNLVVTSPPYALHFKKEYGNKEKKEYIDWFLPFAREIFRTLRDDGSFVLNIGGSYNQGTPTRSVYHFKLLIALVEEIGFHLAQECFWYNPAKMPMPAEWVTVRRIRIRDSVEYVWWLSKTPWPKASNLAVLKEYSEDMIRLNRNGVRGTVRPSGHVIRSSFDKISPGGSIPSNVTEGELTNWPESMLKMGNNAANDVYTKLCKDQGIKIHPARFPAALPRFFVKLLTDEHDLVLDPFAGSNTTGAVAEGLRRRWIAVEAVEEYLKASTFRFEDRRRTHSAHQEGLFD
ncbi:MAG TPA: site-specific DNA-methyltransferase [Terriglobales bacterium]|nr:site-specific DNA-methyltransferase [Terriglobales bacterium]HXF14916.1 site-specific DNA-methyltransferase [Terriglobales bacterium]